MGKPSRDCGRFTLTSNLTQASDMLIYLVKEYLPFNGGPRMCLGQQYAITETLYIITRFVQEFRSIEARDNLPWTETLGLTVTPAHVRVGLCRRS